MSRSYGMRVRIVKPNTRKLKEIQKAMDEIWQFTDLETVKGKGRSVQAIEAYGESNLCGGESEEEFAERFAAAIWKASGGYCEIEIDATYLEDLPYSTHVMGHDEYVDIIVNNNIKNT